jgi:aryl-alcohol dehydrogenase-like predicted oxidoreductase
MIAIEELSRIGFGAHRISTRSVAHRRALAHALEAGCNLIDTASSYGLGESEALIGQCLEETGADAFVVTKGGYLQGDLVDLGPRDDATLPADAVVRISRDAQFSLHPRVLAAVIARSRDRLRRPILDGFLLHNPEHLLRAGVGRDEVRAGLTAAFTLLEEQAAAGRIRYYGVSSDALTEPATSRVGLDLAWLWQCALEVSSRPRFRLLELPFNLVERTAAEPSEGAPGVLARAHALGLVVLGNRPLTARWRDGMVRLADPREGGAPPDERPGAALDECLAMVSDRLAELGGADGPDDLAALRLLADRWTKLSGPELVAQVFDGELAPFLVALSEGAIPTETWAAFTRLRDQAEQLARRAMASRTRELCRHLVAQGRLPPDDARPLPLVACERYLADGIDHVLVGMRSVPYVEALRPLLARRAP